MSVYLSPREYQSSLAPWRKPAPRLAGGFRVVKIEVEFFAQIKGTDRIAVRTRTAKLGNKSFHLEQEIFDTDTQEVKSRCLSILVLYDLEQKLSMPFPDEWRKAISDYDGVINIEAK